MKLVDLGVYHGWKEFDEKIRGKLRTSKKKDKTIAKNWPNKISLVLAMFSKYFFLLLLCLECN